MTLEDNNLLFHMDDCTDSLGEEKTFSMLDAYSS